jgi:hypothetical protein
MRLKAISLRAIFLVAMIQHIGTGISQQTILINSSNKDSVFEGYENEKLPKYTQDQAGAFEVNTLDVNKV